MAQRDIISDVMDLQFALRSQDEQPVSSYF